MRRNTDLKYAVVCILFSLIFLLWLIPTYTPKSSITGDISSAALPSAMMLVILFCGIVMLGNSLMAKKEDAGKEQEETEPVHWIRLLAVIVLVFVYLMALNKIGFYVTTAVALPITLKYFNQSMRLWKIILGTLVLLVFVYVLFEMGLSVKMPRGFFF